MHVGVIAFFICKPTCGSIRGLFKRIVQKDSHMQCDSCGGCHDFRTIQERAEGLSTITRNSTGRGEPKHSEFCGGFLYACALLHCLMLVGVFMNRSLLLV
jgi:hypothetical protein